MTRYTLTGLGSGAVRLQFSPPTDSGLAGEFWRNVRDYSGAELVTLIAGETYQGFDAALDAYGSVSGRVTREDVLIVAARQAVQQGAPAAQAAAVAAPPAPERGETGPTVLRPGWAWGLLAAALLLALIVGAVNGYLAAYLGINSLIVTLGSMFVIRGGFYLYTGQRAIPDDLALESFYQLGNGRLFGTVPSPALVAAVRQRLVAAAALYCE